MRQVAKWKSHRFNTMQTVSSSLNTTWQSFFDGSATRTTNWIEYYHVPSVVKTHYSNTVFAGRKVKTLWHTNEEWTLTADVAYNVCRSTTKIAHIGHRQYLTLQKWRKVRYQSDWRQPVFRRVLNLFSVGLHNHIRIVRKTLWRNESHPVVCVQSAKWDTLKRVYLCHQIQAQAHFTASVQAKCAWNVEKLSVKRTISWGVIVPVGVQVKVIYFDRLKLFKKKSTMWHDRNSAFAKRPIRYRTKKSSVFVGIHPAVRRPKDHRDALLPNVTLRQLDKKKRLELGIK